MTSAWWIFVLALVLAPAPARAQSCDPTQPSRTVYGQGHEGQMTVNGTTSKSYASEFEIDVDVDDEFLVIIVPGGIYVDGGVEVEIKNGKQLWSSLAVDGETRYALRRDGKMKRNDKTFVTLPTGDDDLWFDMTAGDGKAYSLRSDGLVMADDKEIADYDSEGLIFRRIARDGGHVYVLRSDGSVFVDDGTAPVLEFRAGEGDLGYGDGRSVETTWRAMAIDSDGRFLYALRCDGHISRGRLGDSESEVAIASLPYDRFRTPYVAQLYTDIAVAPDGTWYALAADGRVYTQDDELAPLVDLPGSASQTNRVLVDVETIGEDWYALRSDGRVYANGSDVELYDLSGDGYGSLALSDESPPPLESDSKKPKATLIKTKTVVGTPLRIPVVVTDADTCPDDLVVSAPSELPPGATWDAENFVLSWDDPGPAETYTLSFSVTDGTNSVKFDYKLKLKDADTDESKNKDPLVPAFEKAQAIVGFLYELPVIVDDPDGDAVTVSVKQDKEPFTRGAVFDPVTGVFSWTPTDADVGEYTVKFKVTDGKVEKTVKLPLKVKSSLIF